METRKSTDSDLTSDERDVLTRLESAGWFVNQVFTEGNAPNFAYTFGFYETFQHPEVIMFGLPLDTMLTILNEVGRLLRQGVRYAAGDRTDDFLDGYPCEFRRVDPSRYKETLTWTGWFYNTHGKDSCWIVTLRQIAWIAEHSRPDSAFNPIL